ncbi:hypothetical protein N8823_02625 [Candidatus Pseudothioglobus singularis]|nr:hypothetical protein [Candidatus Pseudothioglobus singularis]
MINEDYENLIKELRDKEFLKGELRLKEEEEEEEERKEKSKDDPNELCDFPY